MTRYIKIFWVLFAFLFCIYIIPFVALLGPPRLRDFMHRELVYKVIVDKLIEGASTDKERALRLMKYTNQHLFSNPAGFEIVDKHPLNDLVRGLGECDQLANVLITLARKTHIRGRLIFLRGNKESSQHSVCDLYIDGEFRIFDPTFNIVFINKEDEIATFKNIQNDNINPRPYKPSESLADFNYVKKIYFPLFEPDYKPTYFRTNFEQDVKRFLLSRLVDIYYDIFGDIFLIPYQELYFRLRGIDTFTKARFKHIVSRYYSAIADYDSVIDNTTDSFVRNEALYFKGQIYWDMGRYDRAIEEFERLLKEAPLTKRKRLVLFYLIDSSEKIDDHDRFQSYRSRLRSRA